MEGEHQADQEVDVVGVQGEADNRSQNNSSNGASAAMDLCLASTLSLPEVWLEGTNEVDPNVLVSETNGMSEYLVLRGSVVKLKARLLGYRCTKIRAKVIGNGIASRPIIAPLGSGLTREPQDESRFVFMILAAPTARYYSDSCGDLTVDVEEEDLRAGEIHLKFFFETTDIGRQPWDLVIESVWTDQKMYTNIIPLLVRSARELEQTSQSCRIYPRGLKFFQGAVVPLGPVGEGRPRPRKLPLEAPPQTPHRRSQPTPAASSLPAPPARPPREQCPPFSVSAAALSAASAAYNTQRSQNVVLGQRDEWTSPTLNYRRLSAGPPLMVEHPTKPQYRFLAESTQVFPPRTITRVIASMILFPPPGTMAVFATSALLTVNGLVITKELRITGPDDEITMFIFNCTYEPVVIHAGGTLADVALHKICRPPIREV